MTKWNVIKYVDGDGFSHYLVGDSNGAFCEIEPRTDAEKVANMIANAPEMISCLRELVNAFTSGEHYTIQNPYSRPYVQAATKLIETMADQNIQTKD